ncbi:MAG: biopolymer transporter ExbD [Pirellulaceae bacterium]|jgi:biopolymer transport protein ExbD|nr:biopolymer transporter ExbD [Pirellulaceae bacterium]
MRIERQTAPAAEADLTPMIDMTFQLIAFFMVLINFSQSEQNDKVILPTSELARPADAPIEFPIIVHMTSTGSVIIGGDEISLEMLRSRLAPELSLLTLRGKTAHDANIIIRGHRSVSGGRVQDLISKCQELGFEKFSLRVKEDI